MIGKSASETKVAQDARTSGGRRFTGRTEFLKEWTCPKISLARFSRASTYKIPRRYLSLSILFLETYLAVNAATKVRDAVGMVERILAYSPKSFLSNSLTSCSRESSRAKSGVMMVVVR